MSRFSPHNRTAHERTWSVHGPAGKPSAGKWWWTLALLAVGGNVAVGQEVVQLEVEVEVEEAAEAEEVLLAVQPAFTDENFDQWVFRQHSSAAGARKSMVDQLAVVAGDVHRACKLSTAQQEKLRLAGQGDINRFFDRYEEVKKQFQLKKHDQQKMNEIWQDINPLQTTLMAGVFHADSFLYKSLQNILTEEQYLRYEQVNAARSDFRHRAMIELTINVIEQGVPLQQTQRKQLLELLVAETTPSRRPGQYDYYLILWQLSRLPEQRLRAILDDVQWKVLHQQLNQAKGMEAWLKRQGMLPEKDEAV